MEVRPQTIRLAGGVDLVFEGGWGRLGEQWTLEVTTGRRRHRIVMSAEGTILSIVGLPLLTAPAGEAT
jgi:hypothetical protein